MHFLTRVFIHICTNNSLRYNYRDVLNIYLVYLTIHFRDEESYFMDLDTYEQIPIGADKLDDNFKFVKEEMMCKIISYKGNVFGVEPPMFVELEVTDTEPGFKGDTATGASKPATLETGAQIKVPLFINIGDKLKIDTRTGEYLARA